jgi:hypothetical protein
MAGGIVAEHPTPPGAGRKAQLRIPASYTGLRDARVRIEQKKVALNAKIR